MRRLTTLTMSFLVTLTLSADFCPVTAQHRGAAAGARGHIPNHPAQHAANGGMPQVPAHIQRQMEAAQRQYMQQMQRELQRQQQLIQKQYEHQVNQFQQWLRANAGASLQGRISNLPKTPQGFDRWVATQQKRKAQGKSYDPLYDHFRSFADSMHPRASRARKGPAAKGSRADSAKSRTDTKSGRTEAARKESSRAKGKTVHRVETAKRNHATGQRPLTQDQASISLLRTVHGKLQEADHDYQGHRVQALHHVSEALQQLGSPAMAGLGYGPSLGNMPQAQSDGILRDSLLKLRMADSQLGSRSNAAAHHARARASLGHAIRELEIALRNR